MGNKKTSKGAVASVFNLSERRGFKTTVPVETVSREHLVQLVQLQQMTIQHMLECEEYGQLSWCDHVRPLLDAVETFQAKIST